MSDLGVAVATGWTALRAAIIAPCAVVAGTMIVAEMRRRGPFGQRFLWGLLLASILSPDLVAGYGYRNFSLSLARHPAWNEVFLTLLIGLKATAVAAVMLYFTPEPALSPSARHLLTFGNRVGRWERLRLTITHGSFARVLPAFAVAFLFAFQQFELPSLTGVTAWTVTLFDRQALLPDLGESADPLVWPLAIELIVLAPVVALILRSIASARRVVAPSRTSAAAGAVAWVVIGLTVVLTAALPFAVLLREALPNIDYVLDNAPSIVAYWREIAIAAGFAAPSALLAFLAAVGLLRIVATPRTRVFGAVLIAVICIPGLCGALVPSLAAVELIQHQPLLGLRDTLVPLIAVLALSLLPRAILLEALARLVRQTAGIELARRLRTSPNRSQRRSGRTLVWTLDGFGRFCRISLLAYWGYLDLTAATILAPPGFVPVSARLYNLMHYGHNAALSAMTLVAVIAPLFAFLLVLAGRRLMLRVLP